MIAEKAIYYILKNDAAIAAKVGTRIYNTFAPQDAALPFVVFSISPGGVDPHDSKTTAHGAADLDQISFDVRSVADDVKEAAELDEAVRALLDRYPHGIVAGVRLDGVRYVSTINFPEPDFSDGGGGVVFNYVSEFSVRVKY